MFRGTMPICLDNKGRLAIPTRYRHALEESLVVTIDICQSCLLLYPLAEWKIIEQKLLTLSAINTAERRVQRLLLGHANECQIDNSGRVLIPVTLRHYARLSKNIMLVGQLNKFEIWDEEAWYKQIEEDLGTISSDIACLSDKLKNLTL